MTKPGFAAAMLKIAVDAEVAVPDHVRLAAAVQLKNVISRHWEVPRDEQKSAATYFVLSGEEKEFLRGNVFLHMIKNGARPIHSQLESCLLYIGEHEFPQGWPNILGQIKSTLLSASDPKAVHAALTATYCLNKLYKYQLGDERRNLDLIINDLYASLFQILAKLVLVPGEQSACFVKLIAKSFASSINIEISPLLTEETVFSGWLDAFRTAFSWTVDPALEVPTEDDEIIKARKSSEFLKMKKAISHIFYRVFTKYGNPKFAQKEYKKFSQLVESKYNAGLLTINLEVLQESKTKFVHPHVLSLALKFVSNAVKHPKLGSLVRGSLTDLMQNCAFPRLMMSPANARVWEEDQQEFLKVLFEEEELNDYDPRFAALTLIDSACSEEQYFDSKKEPFHPILAEFLGFLGGVLDKSLKESQPRVFDAALYAIGKLEEEIEKYEVLVGHIEPMIKQFVLSNIENPIGVVRMRCCWIYSQFATVKFKDAAGLLLAFQRIVKALKDKDLSVRVMAALAISKLVSKEDIAEQIRPYVTEIISTYLGLMAEIELEELVESLESVIKTFGDSIRPYAVDLIKELLAAFNRMYQNGKSKGGLAAESNLAAAACIDTISRILQIIGKNQTMLQQVEPLLIPVILQSLNPDELCLMDSTTDILAQLTYYSQKPSAALWQFYPVLIDITVGMPEEVEKKESIRKEGNWAFESVKDLIVGLQNFVTKDPDTFLSGSCPKGKYVDLMFMTISRILQINKENEQSDENDCVIAIKLVITMLEGLKARFSRHNNTTYRASWILTSSRS